MNTFHDPLDLIIVGGGPAGMAAALVAGRARLRTRVLNAEAPRNAVSHASHGLWTRDGAHAHELLEIGKAQLGKYSSVVYQKCVVTAVERSADTFVVHDGGQNWTTRRLVLATGFKDVLGALELPGIEHVYGRSVFPCPFCDGFEHADERWAVFMAAGVEHFVKVLRVWTDDVVVFTHGQSLDKDVHTELQAHGVQVESAPVIGLLAEEGRLRAVQTETRTVARDAGFIGTEFAEPATPFADQFGVPRSRNPWGRIIFDVEEGGRTNVDRLYVVGDAHRQFGGLAAASYDGAICAQHIVHEVALERWSGAA